MDKIFTVMLLLNSPTRTSVWQGGGRGHSTIYYTSLQSFLITSYILILRGLLLNFNWLVHYIECPNVSTTNCNIQKVVLCLSLLGIYIKLSCLPYPLRPVLAGDVAVSNLSPILALLLIWSFLFYKRQECIECILCVLHNITSPFHFYKRDRDKFQ